MRRAGNKVASTQTTPLTAAKRMLLWDMIRRADSATARALAQELPLQDQLRASVARTAHERPAMTATAEVPAEITAIVRAQPAELMVPESKYELLRNTVAQGLTEPQFELFVSVCNRRRLDPFVKQIHAVIRKQWNPVTRQKEPRMVIQTGIDGFRVIAERTGAFEGEGNYQWCGPDEVWRDIWLGQEPPAAARATVWRRGRHPTIMTARWDAYVQMDGEGKVNSMWRQRGPEQLVKCAAALAYRAAFSEDLGDLYTNDEMGQADNVVTATVVQPPKPAARPAANGGKPVPPPAAAPAKPAQQQMAEKVDGPRFARSFPVKPWAGKPMRDAPCETVLDYIQYCEAVLADQSRQDAHKSAATSKAQAEAIYTEIVEREMTEAQARFENSTVPPAIDPITAGLQAEFDRTRNPAHAVGIGDDNLPDSWSK